MKIRNLLIASLAVFSLASCSKDDDGDGPQKPKEPVDAVFSIQLTSDAATKAMDNGMDAGTNLGTVKEQFINTLNAYVFKKDGSLVYYKREEAKNGNSVSEVQDILLKVVPNDKGTSDDIFQMVLIANVADIKVNSLTELQSKSVGDSIQFYGSTTAYLPMMSINKDGFAPIQFTGLTPSTEKDANGVLIKKPNWVASDGSVFSGKDQGPTETKKITLKRLVARVQIDKLALNLGGTYPNASFKLLSVSFANIRTRVTMNGGEGDYIKGYQSTNFAIDQKIIIPGNDKNIIPYFCKIWNKEDAYYKGEYTFIDNENIEDLSKKEFCRYVYPNSGSGDGYYQTGVLIAGMFKVSDKAEGELKHFWVPLNKEGKFEVLPNTIYRLLITINGEGSKNEDKPEITAGVTVQITVADWKVIEQVEGD